MAAVLLPELCVPSPENRHGGLQTFCSDPVDLQTATPEVVHLLHQTPATARGEVLFQERGAHAIDVLGRGWQAMQRLWALPLIAAGHVYPAMIHGLV
jgi:hypothetical protein